MNANDAATSLDLAHDPPFGDAVFLGLSLGASADADQAPLALGRVAAVRPWGVRIDHEGDACLSLGGSLTLMLNHADDPAHRLALPARVTQVLGRGFRRYTFGLTFEGLTDAQRAALHPFLTTEPARLRVA